MTFQPGIEFVVAPLAVGIDAKMFYWNRLGLTVGLLYQRYSASYVTPVTGLSYRLDAYHYLKNTELVFLYAPMGPWPLNMGVRINF